MRPRAIFPAVSLAVTLLGCGQSHLERFVLPDEVLDFSTLFGTNCAGCHGQDGRNGAARPLNDPIFLALIGKDKLQAVIAKGVPGTSMPAFAVERGGSLTPKQVSILADQIETSWLHQQDSSAGLKLPPYTAQDALGG